MNHLEKARMLRPIIEGAVQSLDDAQASQAAPLFPRLKGTGELVKAGTRINWNGVVKRAAVDLWDTENNDPDHSGVLWDDLAYKDGIRIIPETITASLAFAEGEKGWWGDELYISKIEGNVYTPAAYPDGWEKA